MAFHRLTVPSYFGGLPGGYDYINNETSGTPASADGAKVGGPNAGTYFVAFGEDARSLHANRPIAALAENCDALDDLLRRDLATTAQTADATVAGVVKTSITVTGPGIFLGPTGTPNTPAGIATIFQLLDSNDREIVDDVTDAECVITAISGGVVGSNGFSAGDVVLTISPGIPVGVVYRVVYGTRTTLAALPIDALTNIRIRGAQEVSADLLSVGGSELVGANLHAVSFSGAPYALTAGTVFSQITSLLANDNAPYAVRTITTSQLLDSGTSPDATVFLEPGAAINFTLPVASTCKGRKIKFISMKGMVTTTNSVTLVPNGAAKINNVAASYVLDAPYGRWTLDCDGTDWCTTNE